MHDIPDRIADVLLEVEAALRTGGKWEAVAPSREALSSTTPFCVDTLSFEQWLQWVFLPRMKHILEQSQPLPRRSGILAYAQEYLDENDPIMEGLLRQIRRFDDLIAIQSAARKH
jgi:uncharacterized protein YqcC (DUF446 family)